MAKHRFTASTEERLSVVDVTDQVQAALPDDATGTCTVFARHTTTGITVNEAEPRLLGDLETALGDFVPDERWEHDALDGNADSHVRAMLVGPSETITSSTATWTWGRGSRSCSSTVTALASELSTSAGDQAPSL